MGELVADEDKTDGQGKSNVCDESLQVLEGSKPQNVTFSEPENAEVQSADNDQKIMQGGKELTQMAFRTSIFHQEVATYTLVGSVWDCTVFMGNSIFPKASTLAMVFLYLTNIVAQVLFCFIVVLYMLDDNDMDQDYIQQLLRWRLSIGHNVANMDSITQVSLVDKVCIGSASLDGSSSQLSIYGDVDDYRNAGQTLLNVSLLCWLAGIFIELGSVILFYSSVAALRSQATLLELSDDGTSVKFKSLSTRRVVFVFLTAVAPRIFIATMPGVVGVLYLLDTYALPDMLLNCMCLTFVVDIDELMYEAFAPTRVKFLLDATEPLEYPHKHDSGIRSYSQGLILIFALLILAVINIFSISNIMDSVNEVRQVLCEGNPHFVYTVSPSTGRVLASASFEPDEDMSWTSTELALIQLAHPALSSKFFDEDAISASKATDLWAYIVPDTVTSLDGTSASEDDIDLISTWSASTVAEVVDTMSCTDLCGYDPNSTNMATVLGRSIGTESVFCEDAVDYCWMMNKTAMRTNCGKTCGCGSALPSPAGFYQAQNYGCPAGCSIARMLELLHIPCVDANITTIISNDLWRKYVYGLKEYVFSMDGYSSRILEDIQTYHQWRV